MRRAYLPIALVLFLGASSWLAGQQAPTSSAPPTLPTPVAIAKGGTGQITATAAFDALSPVTTRGDLIYRNASNNVRLAAGTSGQFLKTLGSGADPAWAAAPAFTGQLSFGDATGINPVDATTYYFGTLFGVDPGTADNPPGYFVPKAATLVAVYGSFAVAGTLGTTETSTVTIRKNASTDILTVTSTVQLSAAVNDYSSTGNSIAVSAGDKLYIKWAAPTWATNPTVVFGNAVLYFEVP